LKVTWSSEAEDALLDLVIRRNSLSAGSGERLSERIRERANELEQFPRLGRVVPEIGLLIIRELIEPPYRIIYEVFPDRVEIVTIRHSAELLAREDD
jgi:toxin ParE1/3/4